MPATNSNSLQIVLRILVHQNHKCPPEQETCQQTIQVVASNEITAIRDNNDNSVTVVQQNNKKTTIINNNNVLKEQTKMDVIISLANGYV